MDFVLHQGCLSSVSHLPSVVLVSLGLASEPAKRCPNSRGRRCCADRCDRDGRARQAMKFVALGEDLGSHSALAPHKCYTEYYRSREIYDVRQNACS